jgi:hypothetical protein
VVRMISSHSRALNSRRPDGVLPTWLGEARLVCGVELAQGRVFPQAPPGVPPPRPPLRAGTAPVLPAHTSPGRSAARKSGACGAIPIAACSVAKTQDTSTSQAWEGSVAPCTRWPRLTSWDAEWITHGRCHTGRSLSGTQVRRAVWAGGARYRGLPPPDLQYYKDALELAPPKLIQCDAWSPDEIRPTLTWRPGRDGHPISKLTGERELLLWRDSAVGRVAGQCE